MFFIFIHKHHLNRLNTTKWFYGLNESLSFPVWKEQYVFEGYNWISFCIYHTQNLITYSFPLASLIRHSNQNVALNMHTTASSTDNYGGCMGRNCKEIAAFGRFVVDGNMNTCFRSMTEYGPWLMVELNDYHSISLVHIATPMNISLEDVKVSVGNYIELQ